MANEITITITEYKYFIEQHTAARCIINAVMAAASLSYDGEDLRFDDDVIATAVRVILPETYAAKLKALQEAKS